MAEIEKFMNIAVGDIEKIMNIEKGDIEKVMGVELPAAAVGYQGNRSLAMGGYDSSFASIADIEYKALTSDSDTLDFGDSVFGACHDKSSCGSDSRAVFMGGHDAESGSTVGTNNIEHVTIANLGNGTEFGDLLVAGKILAAGSGNGTRGLFVGGRPSSNTDQIEYLTVATPGDAQDAGNLSRACSTYSANANVAPGRMICPMSFDTGFSNKDFNYVAIMSTDTAEDFGDASVNHKSIHPIGLIESKNVWAWGQEGSGSYANHIEHFNPSSLTNTFEFGDLQTIAAYSAGGHTNGTRGEVWGGMSSGSAHVDDIQYITIASNTDATTAGNVRTGARNSWEAWSGD